MQRSVVVLVSLLLFILHLPLLGDGGTPAAVPFVSEVRVIIDNEPGGEEMKHLIPVKEGDAFSLKKVRDCIRQIYKTGLFSDIQVHKEGDQRVLLNFWMTKKLYVRKINFTGSSGIPRRKMRESMYALREGGSFSEDNLSRAVEDLRNSLRKEGFYQIGIEAIPRRDAESSQVDVVFSIHSAKRFIVKNVDFTGDILVSEGDLKKKMKTKEGKEYIPDVLEQDFQRLKEIYHAQDYRRAEVKIKNAEYEETQGHVSLTLEIIPHERIEIVVKGAKIPLDLIRPLWEERIFEEWGLAEGDAKIINYLREKGYLFSSVVSYVEREDSRIRVVHEVSPGEKYRILDVSFEGLGYITSSQIRDALLIEKSIPLFGRISGAKLFKLPQEIEFLYKTYGFPSTHVALNFEKQGNTIRPIFSIEEGNQEIIQSLSIEGAKMFTQEELLEQIASVQGGPFFRPNIQKDIGKLNEFYMNQGVRGAQITSDTESTDEGKFWVNFRISEGRKVTVENVIIAGNKVTEKKTILREVQLKSGEDARLDKIRETKRRLERLGIFSAVKIEELPVNPEKVNLLINVREGYRNYAGLGVGLGTINEPHTFVIWNADVRPRGTAEFIRYNIFGTAAQVSLVGQLSTQESRAVFSLEQPYFFGFPMESYLNAWWEKEERKSFSYDRRGISLTGVRSLSRKENMIFLTTLRMARTTLVELRVSESELDRRFHPFSTTSISGSYIWERRDDPFNPAKGHIFSSVVEWAYPLFKTESDFLKTFFKYQHFVPLFPNVTFSATSRLGLGRGKMPIHERFFAGGSNSFRGVRFDELGPKDFDSSKPIGGKALLLFNFELMFPFFSSIKNLSGAVFYDKGNVFEQRSHISWSSLRDAVGFGLRYRTPLGPIRVEVAWNLNPLEGEKEVLGFITIGHVF